MPELVRKRFRVILDVEVVVEDITREAVSHLSHWEIADRQERLLHSILADEVARDRLIRLSALEELQFLFETGVLLEKLAQVDDVGEERDDILLSQAQRLEPDDADFFQHVHACDVLAENTEELTDQVQAKVTAGTVEVVEETISLPSHPEPLVSPVPEVQIPPQPPPNRAARRAAQKNRKRLH